MATAKKKSTRKTATGKSTTRKTTPVVSTVDGDFKFALKNELMSGVGRRNPHFTTRAELFTALSGEACVTYWRGGTGSYKRSVCTRSASSDFRIGCMTFSRTAENILRRFVGLKPVSKAAALAKAA